MYNYIYNIYCLLYRVDHVSNQAGFQSCPVTNTTYTDVYNIIVQANNYIIIYQ